MLDGNSFLHFRYHTTSPYRHHTTSPSRHYTTPFFRHYTTLFFRHYTTPPIPGGCVPPSDPHPGREPGVGRLCGGPLSLTRSRGIFPRGDQVGRRSCGSGRYEVGLTHHNSLLLLISLKLVSDYIISRFV